MDRFFNKKVAMQSARILSFSLLIIHTWFIFYFHALDVVEMRNLNFLSVLIYIISFWIIQKEKIDWFISIVGIEVMVHMIFAAYLWGRIVDYRLFCLVCQSSFSIQIISR